MTEEVLIHAQTSLRSSQSCHCVIRQMVSNSLEEPAASILRVKVFKAQHWGSFTLLK